MNTHFRNFALWVVIALLLIALFQLFQSPGQRHNATEIAFSQFMTQVRNGNVREVTIQQQTISGQYSNGGTFQTYAPNGADYVPDLEAQDVEIRAEPPESGISFWGILATWFPMLLILGIWLFLMRQMQGGGAGKAMGFGKSKAKMLTEAHGRVMFEDVAGVDEAKEDLQ
ncbi:MAG: ATP-dependent metallopeptidase FtsH/Yme1/Tma family protein, partial [Pseudomonadota bacterium]